MSFLLCLLGCYDITREFSRIFVAWVFCWHKNNRIYCIFCCRLVSSFSKKSDIKKVVKKKNWAKNPTTTHCWVLRTTPCNPLCQQSLEQTTPRGNNGPRHLCTGQNNPMSKLSTWLDYLRVRLSRRPDILLVRQSPGKVVY